MPDLPGTFLTRPVAHRGLHGPDAPENSRAAVVAAMRAGYGIEIDIQASADNVAMVFHDETLERLTAAHGPLSAVSAAGLSKINLNDGQEGIPTLTDILGLVAGQVPLLIEIKDQTAQLGAGPSLLEQSVARALDGYQGDVAVMSFNPHCIHAMRALAPNIARGLVTCRFAPEDWPGVPSERLKSLAEISDFDTTASSFISHIWRDLDAAPVARLSAMGVPILCWTLRNAEDELIARRLAQNITFEGYLP